MLNKYRKLRTIKIAFLSAVFMLFGEGHASLTTALDDSPSSVAKRVKPSLEHIQHVSSSIQILEEQIALAATKENIVVIGKNQTGKSTLIACMLDQPLHGMTKEDGERGVSYVYPRATDGSVTNPLLSRLTRIETPWVDVWYKTGGTPVYWAFRGLFDPEDIDQRTPLHEGWQWIAMQRILQSLSVKIMIVAPYTSGRSSHPKLYSMLSLVTELFPREILYKNACLVVTKSDPDVDVSLHMKSLSHDIATNTALVSADGKALLSAWAAQGASRITGFPIPTNEGVIDTTQLKESLQRNVEHLSSQPMTLLPFTESSAVLPSSQIKAQRIHHFLNACSIDVVHTFCRDLALFLTTENADTPFLNLTNYWQAFTNESPRQKRREKDDVLKFLTFIDSTETDPQGFIHEWEDVFGKEGETVINLLRALESLRDFPGFTDVDRAVLRRTVDRASNVIIKRMEKDLKDAIRQTLREHRYAIESPPSRASSSPSRDGFVPDVKPIEVTITLEPKGGEAYHTPSQKTESRTETRSLIVDHHMPIASGNKIGADNVFSVASPTAHVHCAHLCGDNPCRDCCKGLMDVLRFCFPRDENHTQDTHG